MNYRTIIAAIGLLMTAPPSAIAAGQADGSAFGRCLEQENGSSLTDARCYVEERERLREEQNRLLQQIYAQLAKPDRNGADYKAASVALHKAQVAWDAYVGADCAVIDPLFGNGTALGLAGETCTIDHYSARIALLRALQRDYLNDA